MQTELNRIVQNSEKQVILYEKSMLLKQSSKFVSKLYSPYWLQSLRLWLIVT